MSDYIRFGEVLAELHHCSQKDFGFSTDNFIGSLPQRNNTHAGWAEFYWFERILPQLQSALKAGLIQQNIIPKEKDVIPLFQEIFGDVKPSLLHGDLWGGNYLISTNGVPPCLIDPAVYYGHSMVDIAMSGLFGGFGTEFYNAYHEIIPKTENYHQQIDLYQLYYLLVHLNLFGSGYYSSVSSILKKIFLIFFLIRLKLKVGLKTVDIVCGELIEHRKLVDGNNISFSSAQVDDGLNLFVIKVWMPQHLPEFRLIDLNFA